MSDEPISQIIVIEDGAEAKAKPLRQNFNFLNSQISTLQSSLANKESLSSKNAANGYCGLNSSSKIPIDKIDLSALKTNLLEDSDFTDSITSDTVSQDLDNLSDTGKAVIDGQWVTKFAELTTLRTGTVTLDFSDYLPDDDYSYDVMFSVQAHCGSNAWSMATITEYVIDIIRGKHGDGNNDQYLANTFVCPVTSSRSLTLSFYRTFSYFVLNACAYRRIGTNQ